MKEPGADHRFMESAIRSTLLLGCNSGRKTAAGARMRPFLIEARRARRGLFLELL